MRSFYHAYRLDFMLFMKVWGVGFFACGLSFWFLYLSQPPGDFPEAAYFFLLPVLIWFNFRPKSKVVLTTMFISGFIYHIGLIGWIRHVTLPGMILASIIITSYLLPWYFLGARWVSRNANAGFTARLTLILALSSLWVVIEWARSLFSLGFPWCPLSVTQWERPAILQLVPLAGGWVVSFFLVFFNLCVGSYLHHLLIRRRRNPPNGYFSSLCPDFYICMAFFLLMLSPLFLDKPEQLLSDKKRIRVGVCQPYLKNKWAPENIASSKRALIEQTKILASLNPDLIVWPEASTPYPVNLDRAWVEKLCQEIGIPILAGAIIREEEWSYNAVVKVEPESGLSKEWYAKQILVPFGEYIPFPFSYIPGLTRLVGPVGTFTAGNEFLSFSVITDHNTSVKILPLVCYEDIFPGLAGKMQYSANSLIFVTTNDAWFAEEGCAEQHAAHSVIRALETGMPVLRCGNAGWSGWISPRGVIREVLHNNEGSVYFKGASVLEIEWHEGDVTFFTKNGNYFIALCLIFVIFGWYIFEIRAKTSIPA